MVQLENSIDFITTDAELGCLILEEYQGVIKEKQYEIRNINRTKVYVSDNLKK